MPLPVFASCQKYESPGRNPKAAFPVPRRNTLNDPAVSMIKTRENGAFSLKTRLIDISLLVLNFLDDNPPQKAG